MPLAPELPRAEYDALDALNWSRLKLLEVSPAHFKLGYSPDSSGFGLGTAGHAAVLEPDKFEQDFAIYPGPVRRGKAWEEFETAAIRSGKTIITSGEKSKAVQMRDSVFRNPRAASLLTGGRAEFSMVWTLGGNDAPEFQCKGRGDYLHPAAMVDLKTTKDASPRGFAWACQSYGYLGQAAWYSDGYTRLTGERLPFAFVAVENAPPFVTEVYWVTDDLLERGRDQYLTLLGRLAYCRQNDWWGGYSESGESNLLMPA